MNKQSFLFLSLLGAVTFSIAQRLNERSYIDENRTGIWGWSYGVFMPTNYILKGNVTFEMAITMRMVEALVQANKQFDWAIYPDKNHGIYGGNTSLHLYTKLTNFIKENL